MESFRKAYGALKDSTKVGLAKVNSEFKDLDIAIVKATNHVEHPPKERHVRKIFTAVSVACPRADVGYCIHALSKRLQKTRNWIHILKTVTQADVHRSCAAHQNSVAIKSLIVFHRILRECDASFKEELLHITRRGNLFQISNFKDDSSPLAWDCSGWVRTYALFLEERLQCFRRLKYDIESDRALKKSSTREIKEQRKFQLLNGEELLEQLPAMQQLLFRLICCQPEGAARYNYLVQYALALVVKESFKLYCAINDGIVSLVDTYFEMPKNEAVKALTIYKKAGRQAEHLADFYDFCRTLDLARTFQFPILRQPPPSFLATMEEYLKEAPLTAPVAQLRVEYREATKEAEITEEPAKEEAENEVEEDKNKQETTEEAEPVIKQDDQPLISAQEPVGLLGLNEINPQALQLEESNALALAIVQPGSDPLTNNNALTAIGNTSGWELALVTAPSNTSKPQICHPNMAGGFDKLLLDSLYEDNAARRQSQLHNAGYSASGYYYGPQNMFNQHDPFAMSNNIAPPTDVQMAMMAQQHQMVMQNQQQYQMMTMQHQQHNMMVPYNNTYPHQQMPQIGPSNPFGYPAQTSMPPHGNHTLL